MFCADLLRQAVSEVAAVFVLLVEWFLAVENGPAGLSAVLAVTACNDTQCQLCGLVRVRPSCDQVLFLNLIVTCSRVDVSQQCC